MSDLTSSDEVECSEVTQPGVFIFTIGGVLMFMIQVYLQKVLIRPINHPTFDRSRTRPFDHLTIRPFDD